MTRPSARVSASRSLLPSLLVAAAAVLPLSAQDYEQIAPKPVPTTPSRDPLPPEPPPPSGDDSPLLENLRGVRILDSVEAVRAGGASVEGLELATTNPLLSTEAFRTLLEPRLGRPLSLRDIDALSRDIVLYFRAQDRPLVDVVVPEQDITGGVLQLVVVEGRVGRVRAEGNRWFSSARIEGGVRPRPGDPVVATQLLADLDWLNQNPFRSVDVLFAPGEALGETDIVLRTQDRLPLRLYVGYENTGSELTGETRLYAGFNWGDAFGLDGQLNYQFSVSDDFEAVRIHSMNWSQPLPWRHTLTFFGAHVRSEAEIGPFTLSGQSVQLGLRYTAPLPSTRVFAHEVYAGFDWKRADNALEFGIPITDSLTEVGQWVAGYRGTLHDSFGVTRFQIEGAYNPAGWFANQSRVDYAGSRPGAEPEFAHARLDLSRLTRLPADFTLSHAFTAQLASTNLLPSEQLGVGGRRSVRGYEEHTLTASDEGWTIQNELRLPPFSPIGWLSARREAGPLPPAWRDQLQFLVFYDYGRARPDDRATGYTALASVGAGLRYTVGTRMNIQADYGHRLRDLPGDTDEGRWHLGAMLAW
jgi:Hemolysin activation/secretion protein